MTKKVLLTHVHMYHYTRTHMITCTRTPIHHVDSMRRPNAQIVVNEEELTFGCGEGGRLIKSTFCFIVTHAECCDLGDQRTNVPRGVWACPACIDHARAQLAADNDDDATGDGESTETGEKRDDGKVKLIRNPSTTVRVLKAELRQVGLKVSGSKQELVRRLLEYYDSEQLEYMYSILQVM